MDRLITRLAIRAVQTAHFLPDCMAVRILYRLYLGWWPDLAAPKLFGEKLQWLKLHDRQPRYRVWADKLRVRGWIADNLWPGLLIPLYASYDLPSELYEHLHNLPGPVMIKGTHGSHCGMYVPDPLAADADAIERRVMRWTGRDWYWVGREWPYRGLTPRILCEAWIGDADGNPPDDYKWMTFGGRARVLQLHRKRGGVHHIDYYDRHGLKYPWGLAGYPNDGPLSIPTTGFDAMIRIAERIAQGTRYLRVDLYYVGGRVYFGEATLYDSSGFGAYTRGGDAALGAMLQQD